MRSRFLGSLTVVFVLFLSCRPVVDTAAPGPAEPARVDGLTRLGTPCRASATTPSQTAPDIDCAAPPATFNSAQFLASTSSSQQAQAGPTFDSWAWSSFAAFNWPAKADANQPTDYVRGVPDTTATFRGASGADVVVWETFKEKREVFTTAVSTVSAASWQDLTYPLNQEIVPLGGQVPPCTAQDGALAAGMPGGGHRRVLQASKLSPALTGGDAHQLDETAEVASPAQEPQATLCAGYVGAAYAQCQSYFPLPPGKGQYDPFPPTVLNPRNPVGPRVFDPNGNIVFYEVRVNYDYFNYVVGNGINVTPPPPPAPAPQPPYALPWRTSAMAGPGGPGTGAGQSNTTPVIKYDPNAIVTQYAAAPATPPLIGSVQVKSAWKMLATADPSYHTTQAIYFQSTAGDNRCYKVGTFGLIGLHIIQRIHNGVSTDTSADGVGGTFIFATWEHNSIGNGAGYSYVNFLASATDTTMPYPAVSNAIPVTRQQPYPLAKTQGVTQGVYNQLPANSVWRNYRLIGTQFYVNVGGSAATSLQYNQPFYLANLVIETNTGLQNFQGLPPNVTPVTNYNPTGGPFTNTGAAFNPLVPNVAWKEGVNPPGAYNMGGCMGCHGVAQLKGSNFSFVLLDGQGGAGIDTPTSISIPP